MPIKKSHKIFDIRNKTANTAEIILYGAIGGGFFSDGVSAKEVVTEIKKLPASITNLEVRINSPGGDVFEGTALYNVLSQHKAKKTVYIDGLAASIASIIALAGDDIVMGDGALYMIHLPWTFTAGNRNELDNTVNRLLDVEEQLISIYAKKTRMSRQEIKSMLEKETWMDADTAIELGFVDRKSDEESLPIAASVFDKATWINKAPKNYKSQEQVARKDIAELKNKISGFLARK